MRETIEACYTRLQTLNIQPTKTNMEKLLQTLYDLKEVYDEMGEEDERNQADPE